MEPYQALESEFGRWAGVENVVACSSGTAALHLALEALRLPPGSEVLVPDFAMIAVARAVSLAGLTPVFVDCDDRLCLNPYLLSDVNTEREVLRNVRVVLAAHTYGRQCDMDEVTYYAGEHGWAVIEDLAEAHGVRPHEGTDASCWSFYKNKIIAGEEGGCVAFRDPARAALARQLRCQGFTEKHDFTHIPRGHNYRLANTLASLVRASLRFADANLLARRYIEGVYDQYCPSEWRLPRRDVCWVYDLRIPGLTRERQDAAIAALRAEGVEARHAFRPLSTQEEYRSCRVVGDGRAARLAAEVLYLPVCPGVTTEDDVRRSFDVLRRVVS